MTERKSINSTTTIYGGGVSGRRPSFDELRKGYFHSPYLPLDKNVGAGQQVYVKHFVVPPLEVKEIDGASRPDDVVVQYKEEFVPVEQHTVEYERLMRRVHDVQSSIYPKPPTPPPTRLVPSPRVPFFTRLKERLSKWMDKLRNFEIEIHNDTPDSNDSTKQRTETD